MGGGLRGWPCSTRTALVVAEGWATSEDELARFLSEHDPGGAVVALDAPLVVTQPGRDQAGV